MCMYVYDVWCSETKDQRPCHTCVRMYVYDVWCSETKDKRPRHTCVCMYMMYGVVRQKTRDLVTHVYACV